jgi:uncharacterized protein YciI
MVKGPTMKYFLCKLIAPRPLFGMDFTEVETAAMRAHVAHWTKAMEQGKAIVFGPVADPQGFWGVGIVQVENEAELEDLTANDPVILANLGFKQETYPMPQIKIRGEASGRETAAQPGS